MTVENNSLNISSLKINGAELSNLLAVIQARQNSLTSALSSTANDYNTEIIDARADAFGNSYADIGTNIRENQKYLANLIQLNFSTLTSQNDKLAQAIINLSHTVNSLIDKEE